MSKDCCMDCGVILSPHSNVCNVCGFDNGYDPVQDMPLEDGFYYMDTTIIEVVPESYPGF